MKKKQTNVFIMHKSHFVSPFIGYVFLLFIIRGIRGMTIVQEIGHIKENERPPPPSTFYLKVHVKKPFSIEKKE